MKRVFIIGEVGINHNGQLELAKQLIDGACVAGCDAVKFQKRTVDKVYSKELLDSPRNDGNPYGWTTQREQKNGIELGKTEYDEIDRYCKEKGIEWFASAWDVDAQLFLRQYNLKFNKIASAMLTNIPLLEAVAEEGRYTFVSVGMSTFEEIDNAIKIFVKHNCPFELMYCVSTYPMENKDANLLMIRTLKEKYKRKVGWSDHSQGRLVSTSAVAVGASSIERHITINKAMYGSDQAASLELEDMRKLVIDIRGVEIALGNGIKEFSEAELKVRKKLRGV
jgi:N-acetylneuraminate synthase